MVSCCEIYHCLSYQPLPTVIRWVVFLDAVLSYMIDMSLSGSCYNNAVLSYIYVVNHCVVNRMECKSLNF